MTPESKPISSCKHPEGKPFPRYCQVCRKRTVWPVAVPYTSNIRFEGVLHSVETPARVVPRCQECGELYFDNDAEAQVSQAFRDQLHLLQPEQIHANRLALGLDVLELAARLGVPTELLANWEEGLQFQTRAHDNLMRAFFAVPEVRSGLQAEGTDPTFGQEIAGAGS